MGWVRCGEPVKQFRGDVHSYRTRPKCKGPKGMFHRAVFCPGGQKAGGDNGNKNGRTTTGNHEQS